MSVKFVSDFGSTFQTILALKGKQKINLKNGYPVVIQKNMTLYL